MGSKDERGGDPGARVQSSGQGGAGDGEIVAFPGAFFPGVGRIDELVPMGSAAGSPVITRSAEGDDGEGGEADVLAFPGVGRVDELVPMESRAVVAPGMGVGERLGSGSAITADKAPPITADSFWGEDSPALHQPIAAPSRGVERPVAGRAARPRSLGRPLVPIVLALLCVVAGLAFALHAAGERHARAHASVKHRAEFAPVRVPRAEFPPVRVPRAEFPPVRAPRSVVVRRPAARSGAAVTNTMSPPHSESATPAEPAESEPAQSRLTQSEPTQSQPAESQPVQSEPASSAATGSSGSGDIGAGSGLPGPGGPPSP